MGQVVPFQNRKPIRIAYEPKPASNIGPAAIVAILIGVGFVLGLMARGL